MEFLEDANERAANLPPPSPGSVSGAALHALELQADVDDSVREFNCAFYAWYANAVADADAPSPPQLSEALEALAGLTIDDERRALLLRRARREIPSTAPKFGWGDEPTMAPVPQTFARFEPTYTYSPPRHVSPLPVLLTPPVEDTPHPAVAAVVEERMDADPPHAAATDATADAPPTHEDGNEETRQDPDRMDETE